MRIAVCDDEAACREELIKQIWANRSYCPENGLDLDVDEYESGEALMAAYDRGLRYDIVFSDIRMKKADGMTAAEYLRGLDSRVVLIMVTSFASYAIKGYELRIFRYLLKPVTPKRFQTVFCEALEELKLLARKSYVLKSRDEGNLIVPLEHICYFESFGRKLCMVRDDGTQQEFYGSMGELETELSPRNFVRIHKSYLVNVEKVQGISKTDITLIGGKQLPLSAKRYVAVWERIGNFVLR